jgi:hypothetical protein
MGAPYGGALWGRGMGNEAGGMRLRDALPPVLATTLFLGGALAASAPHAVAAPLIAPAAVATAPGHVGNFYSAALTFAAGASGSVVSGELPPGLALAGGQISGVPTAAGAFTFEVRAATTGATATAKYTILVNPAVSTDYDARMGQVLVDRDVAPAASDCNQTGSLTYAIADLWLDQDPTEANRRMATFKITQIGGSPKSCGGKANASRDNLDLSYLIRPYMLYNSNSTFFPGRLTPAAQSNLLAQIYAYARPYSKISQAADSWSIFDSENHDAQAESFDFLAAQAFKDSPAYSNKKYADGSTVAQQYKAWHDHWSNYFDERAKRGLFIEEGSPTYHGYTLDAILNIYDFADDPILRQKAGMVLDLDFADYVQQEFNGIWGGPKSRSYPTDSIDGANDSMTNLGDLLFGTTPAINGDNHVLMLATSGYYPPPVVVSMAQDRTDMGSFEYVTRRPGYGLTAPDTNDDWHVTATKSVLNYSYVTPNYIIGTTELWPKDPHIAPSSQNRWEGITFNAGSGTRIYPQAAPSNINICNDAFLSVQVRTTLVTEKRTTGKGITAVCAKAPTLVYFPASLDGITERDGWIFVTEGPTYVAIRPNTGLYHWLTPAKNHAAKFSQRFIQLSDPSSPIIFETANAAAFSSATAFQNSIIARPRTNKGGLLQYTALDSTRFTMFKDQTLAPLVNGRLLNYAPPKVFNSPYLQSTFGSGQITVSFGSQSAVYDFSNTNNPQKVVR